MGENRTGRISARLGSWKILGKFDVAGALGVKDRKTGDETRGVEQRSDFIRPSRPS